MKEAFIKYTGIDLDKCTTKEELYLEIKKNKYHINPEYSWEEMFNSIFLSEVELNLPSDNPVILYDYPAQIPCLAKQTKNNKYYERWELYINGMESANCYTEETDKQKIDSFSQTEGILKQKSHIPHNIDFSYTDLFENSFPECSGVAMGIDRLVMAITGAENIKEVMSFIF